jgi:hypothetical protein
MLDQHRIHLVGICKYVLKALVSVAVSLAFRLL